MQMNQVFADDDTKRNEASLHNQLTHGRRDFLTTTSAALIGLSLKSDRPIPGSFVNESAQLGHQLRDHSSFTHANQIRKIPSRHRRRRNRRPQRRMAPPQTRLHRLRPPRNERRRRRQRPLGRKRNHRLSLGRALHPHPRPQSNLRPRTLRRSRRPAKRRLERALPLLLAARAPLPLRPLARRHRARHRPQAERSRTIPAPRRNLHHPPQIRRIHHPARTRPLTKIRRPRQNFLRRLAPHSKISTRLS